MMGGENGGGSIDFKNDGVLDHDVGAKAQWIRYDFANDGHDDLGFESTAGMAQFQSNAFGVHQFQQAWTYSAMDFNGEADNPFREGLVFKHEELVWRTVVLGVLRGENFKSVNRHEQRCPGDAVGAPLRYIDPERTKALRMAIGPQPNAIAVAVALLILASTFIQYCYPPKVFGPAGHTGNVGCERSRLLAVHPANAGLT